MTDTRQPRVAGKDRQPTVTLLGVDERVKSLTADHDSTKSRVTSLEDKVTAQQAASDKHEFTLYHPAAKNGLVRTARGVTSAHKRIAALEATIGNLDLVGNAIAAKQTGNVKSVIALLQEANCTPDQIAKTLVILHPEDTEKLTNEEFLAELFTAFMTNKDATNKELHRLDENIIQTQTRVKEVYDNQAKGFTEIRKEITEISTTSETPKWALPVAAIVGVIAALIWGNAEFGETIGFTVGDQFGSAEIGYNPLDSFYAAVIFGFGVFLAVLGLIDFTSRNKTRTTQQDSSESKTSTKLISKFKRSKNDKNNQDDSKDQSTSSQDTSTDVQPAQGHTATPAPASAPASV